MHYRIYIDTLFVNNFVITYFLLVLTRRLFKCSATHLSLLLGAAIGSAADCILVIIPGIPAIFKIILAYSVISLGIVCVSLRLKEWHLLIRATMYFYCLTFLCGGFLRWIFTRVSFLREKGITSLAVVLLSFWGFLVLQFAIKKQQEKGKKLRYEIFLKIGNRQERVTAILDTGNQLYEPISKRPVCIVEEQILHEYIKNEMVTGFCVIPYHSIGKKNGVLEGYEIEEMEIKSRNTQMKRKKVVVAVSKEKVSASNQYQMILHPQLIED